MGIAPPKPPLSEMTESHPAFRQNISQNHPVRHATAVLTWLLPFASYLCIPRWAEWCGHLRTLLGEDLHLKQPELTAANGAHHCDIQQENVACFITEGN